MEAGLIEREGIPFKAIPAAGLHGVGLKALPGNLLRLARGVTASRKILAEFQPDVLLFTGGFVAAPMAVAARRLPALLYVPDIEPGLALKFLAKWADCIALTAETSRRYFNSKARIEVTGYPIRPELSAWSRAAGQKELGLDEGLPTLLVFGGSKGARSLNRAVTANLNELLESVQIVHITGSLDWEEVQAARNTLPAGKSVHYHIFEYLHDMGAALACADLVVSRAGASTLGELTAFGLPAILVPYPYAWRYQKVNADYLANRGGALVIEDRQLAERLPVLVRDLLADRQRLSQMSTAMRALARPEAARRLADLILELAGDSGRKVGPS